jgi:hypothetical protein
MTTSDQKFKADAGKLQARLLFEGCPRALQLAIAVLSYGAQKYEAHSWRNVDVDRYKDAKARHMVDGEYEFADDESGLWHKAHELINLMFIIELETKQMDNDSFRELLRFNKPPTSHKE